MLPLGEIVASVSSIRQKSRKSAKSKKGGNKVKEIYTLRGIE